MTFSMDLSRYSALETLRNGRMIEIRAIKPEDRNELMKTVGRASKDSIYRRFFSTRRDFSDKEVDYYLDVDFTNHVALVAVLEEAGCPIIAGGGRYIVYQPGCAELAFGLEDAYQGLGIASVLMRHIAELACKAGLDELHADVLPGNLSMLKVFKSSGLPVSTKRTQDTLHITLRLR